MWDWAKILQFFHESIGSSVASILSGVGRVPLGRSRAVNGPLSCQHKGPVSCDLLKDAGLQREKTSCHRI